MSHRFTTRTLADGREIIYVDEPGTPERTAPDLRPVEPRVQSGEVRYDALVDDWVAVAAHRQNRTFMPPKDECPLCPACRGTAPSEIPESEYQVVVFENRFPSYAVEAAGCESSTAAGLLDTRPAVGRCEVVCFTSDHESSFKDLSVDRVRTVVDTWAQRTEALGARPEVQQVFAFENRGREIGVTLPHPHGQIYAYPYVPARTRQLLDAAERHLERTGRLLGADLLAAEREDGSRVVIEGRHWTAYVPFAARWPVEVHLAPHRDVPDLVALDDDERDDLAAVYHDLLGRLDRYYVAEDGSPVALPYIAAWQQAPAKVGRDASRLHLQLMSVLRGPGRLKYLAGSESGVGGWVNDVAPERAAARLREVAP
ncbi:galactose-1-phosphate uridylyltransferase [Intrasporangium flavum]|uniref:galactose-1-phosphate uridylyltransferase n=1 Tax=Intrasporangium flavum TaxID=1428657 RepID=UPI00096EA5EB|nr:galactose-1-phosphate uridylyltransferase [Intrasporangium flavum]